MLLAVLLALGEPDKDALPYVLGLGMLGICVGLGMVVIARKNWQGSSTSAPAALETAPDPLCDSSASASSSITTPGTLESEPTQPSEKIRLNWITDLAASMPDREGQVGAPSKRQDMQLEESVLRALTEIQKRFEQLLQERIPACYHPAEWPNLLTLVKSGRRESGFSFPYGGVSCSLIGHGPDVKLMYNDHVRIAGGWGRRYEISATATTLLEENLD
jgi:hypothetical protein